MVFDANGDTTMSTLSVMKVENGDFAFVKLFRQRDGHEVVLTQGKCL